MTETRAVQVVADMLPVIELKRRFQAVMEAKRTIMVDGVDYAVIPGTLKPSLLQPGGEKLSVLFRLSPSFTTRAINLDGDHREYLTTCTLTHGPSGTIWATADGLCTTMEKKYRWRESQRKCPNCGKESIIKGRKEFGGGWVCFAKNGGCGSKWADGSGVIESQSVGKIENPDIADMYNTCLKMAAKRAFMAAVKLATASSDHFTQDMEDFTDVSVHDSDAESPIDTFLAGMRRAFDSGGLAAVSAYWSGEGQPLLKAASPEERQFAIDLREKLKAESAKPSAPEPKRRGRPPKAQAAPQEQSTEEATTGTDAPPPAASQ